MDGSVPEQLAGDALVRDLDALRRELVAELGPADLAHFRRLARIGRACTLLGYATAWIAPNPISAALLSLGTTTRWMIVMHHVSHRALDRVPGAPPELRGARFARGRRRWIDWLDWISPAAWHVEHDDLHHAHTGTTLDPDLVEDNLAPLRAARLPRSLKLAAIAGLALTWRLTYYAPSTFQMARRVKALRTRGEPVTAESIASSAHHFEAFDPRTEEGRAFWRTCVLPYGLARFVLAPLAFLPLGPWAAGSVLANSVAAELLANVHSFAVIVPNHAGDDVTRFDGPAHGRADFYERQIRGSVNYQRASRFTSFLCGYLDLQIEHHLFPDLPPSAYERAAPRVRAICEKHGLPYKEESLATRCRKALSILIGEASMLR